VAGEELSFFSAEVDLGSVFVSAAGALVSAAGALVSAAGAFVSVGFGDSVVVLWCSSWWCCPATCPGALWCSSWWCPCPFSFFSSPSLGIEDVSGELVTGFVESEMEVWCFFKRSETEVPPLLLSGSLSLLLAEVVGLEGVSALGVSVLGAGAAAGFSLDVSLVSPLLASNSCWGLSFPKPSE